MLIDRVAERQLWSMLILRFLACGHSINVHRSTQNDDTGHHQKPELRKSNQTAGTDRFILILSVLDSDF